MPFSNVDALKNKSNKKKRYQKNRLARAPYWRSRQSRGERYCCSFLGISHRERTRCKMCFALCRCGGNMFVSFSGTVHKRQHTFHFCEMVSRGKFSNLSPWKVMNKQIWDLQRRRQIQTKVTSLTQNAVDESENQNPSRLRSTSYLGWNSLECKGVSRHKSWKWEFPTRKTQTTRTKTQRKQGTKISHLRNRKIIFKSTFKRGYGSFQEGACWLEWGWGQP